MTKKNDYNAENITVLKGLDPVRKRAGMYIGNTGRTGLNHLVQEIIDNAVDEHLAGECSEIYVSVNKDGSCTISDNGRGIPVDEHPTEKIPAERVIFTVLHAGGKFNDAAYKISGGLHGVGSSVVNALTKELVVDVFRDGVLSHDSYAYGTPTTDLVDGMLPCEKLLKAKQDEIKKYFAYDQEFDKNGYFARRFFKENIFRGTTVTLYPDETIFTETVKFKANAIKQRLKETSYLNPGLTIYFENKRDDEEVITFSEPDGLNAFVKDISEGYIRYTPIINISGEFEGISADICFAMTEDGEETLVGFTNNITNTEGGTHINGFKAAFAKIVNQYARNDLGLLKEKDANLNGSEIRHGMSAIISVRHPDPQFEGQTKTKLGSTDCDKAIQQILTEQLTLFFDRNREVIEAISEKAVALNKKKSLEKNKVNLSKFSFEGNGKLSKQESSEADKCEIFIVEGDSAGGSAKTARNRKYQAILPLRGKILNIEKCPIEKVLENAEVKALINAFGCGFLQGYGNDFDIEKLNYGKIIVMTDADVDGAHIQTLLLTFFYRFYPELINQGHIYLATPPLYGVSEGKGMKYLYSDEELEKYKSKKAGKKLTIQRYKGLGEMDAQQLYETTMNPDTRVLKQISIDSLIESNSLTEILMGSDVAPRRAYIEKHSREATIDM